MTRDTIRLMIAMEHRGDSPRMIVRKIRARLASQWCAMPDASRRAVIALIYSEVKK